MDAQLRFHICETSRDKMQMFQWLTEHGYKTARSYTDLDTFRADVENNMMTFLVFVKPVRGSAFIAISKVQNTETVESLFKHSDNLMIQKFLDVQEIGADVYIDLISGEVVSIFTKKKIKIRAGEMDKAVSFKDEKLLALIE